MLRSLRLAPVAIRAARNFIDWTKVPVGVEDFFDDLGSAGKVNDYFLFGPQARKKMIDRIEVYSDKEYGGKSESNWTYIDEDKPNERALRFYGTHRKFQPDPTKKDQPIKAYNAMKIFYKGDYSLGHFQGLEIYMRSSKAWKYIFSMYCNSLQEFDCMQVELEIKQPNTYYRFYVPFNSMQYSTLIHAGIPNIDPEIPNIEMTSLGFLIKDPPPDSAMDRMPVNTPRSARLFKENFLKNRAMPVRFD